MKNDGSQTILVTAKHYDSRPIGLDYGEKHFKLCMDAITQNAEVHGYIAERGGYKEKDELPKQKNPLCGVYVLAYTEYHRLGYQILDFDDTNMPFFRVKYAYELLTSDHIYEVKSLQQPIKTEKKSK